MEPLLAAILYQGHLDSSHKLWNIVSTEIYIPYAGAAEMLLHIVVICRGLHCSIILRER